jgi:hypothetical protein
VAPAIMSNDCKLIMLELHHQCCKIISHRALSLLAVIITDPRSTGLSIATHIRADNGIAGRSQARRDPVPGCRGPGMAMNKKERRTDTTEPHPKLHVPEIDHLVSEAFEQWSPPASTA